MKLALFVVGGLVAIVLIAAFGASLPQAGSDERHV
jgi:hypothetical protein